MERKLCRQGKASVIRGIVVLKLSKHFRKHSLALHGMSACAVQQLPTVCSEVAMKLSNASQASTHPQAPQIYHILKVN